jgi:hypothetical protein
MASVMFAKMSGNVPPSKQPKPQSSLHALNISHKSLKIRICFSQLAKTFFENTSFGVVYVTAVRKLFHLVPAYFENTQDVTKEFIPMRGDEVSHALFVT